MPITQATKADRKRSIPLHHSPSLTVPGSLPIVAAPYDEGDDEQSGGGNAPVVDPARPSNRNAGQPRVRTVRSGRRHASRRAAARQSVADGPRGKRGRPRRERPRATGRESGAAAAASLAATARKDAP